jgi:hypothetical protein
MNRSRDRALRDTLRWGLLIGFGLTAGAALAQPQVHVDLFQGTTGVPDKASLTWPGSYSVWEELHPTRGILFSQTSRVDNDENGLITFNDYIELRPIGQLPIWYRVMWSGSTYFVTPLGGGVQNAFEALSENAPGIGPVGELWQRVVPTYGATFTVAGWVDMNSSGLTDAGDRVAVDGTTYVIDRIGLDLVLEEAEPIPLELRSWGEVKRIY